MVDHVPFGARKILIDTNLLVLLVVGLTSKDIIKHKKNQRCRQYGVQEFELLRGLLGAPRIVICLPNIVAETYSLLKQHKGDDGKRILAKLSEVVIQLAEAYIESRKACQIPESAYVGITDAAILLAAAAEECSILTADAALYLAAQRRGIPSLNFWHVREEML